MDHEQGELRIETRDITREESKKTIALVKRKGKSRQMMEETFKIVVTSK